MPKSKKNILMTGAAMTSAIVFPFATTAQVPTRVQNLKKPQMHTAFKYPTRGEKSYPKTAVAGTVAAINGTTLTVTGKNGTTYTIDASKAQIAEGRFISGLTLTMIQVGDNVIVNGTVSGTSVAARMIMDSSLMGRNIFTGTVASVSGSTITISGKNGATSTVDATSAAITRGFLSTTSGTIGDISIGDRLTIVGTISGTMITASAIRDLGQMSVKAASHGKTPFISGTVSAISGSIITVAGVNGTTYAVDASQAKLSGGMFSSGLMFSDIRVGDNVMISGPMNGTSVTAKTINDASLVGRNVFTGTVSSVSGTTITLNAKNMTTLTVDASSATITKGFLKGSTITVSDIKKGDRITVIGTSSGATIIANTINDIGQFSYRAR